MDLYLKTSLACSRRTTLNYSTSFSVGILLFRKEFRTPVYAIYGFVRFADEIVDTFQQFDQRALFDKFRADTWEAIRAGISTNPILHSFQHVVNRYKIDHQLIEAFLHSMEMDLTEHQYDKPLVQQYIYGSAEVVGLMCLRVFYAGQEQQYEALKPSARKLGEAFQKINFLRDLREDFVQRGRIYFPGTDFSAFGETEKKVIIADIQNDFQMALTGIRQLKKGVRLGVYLAYLYYTKLLRNIDRTPASRLMEERIRVPDSQKLLIFFVAWINEKLNTL